jgi:hypothetical protein
VPNLKAVDLRVMVPARNFAISKAFYEAIGCRVHDVTTELAFVKLAASIFRTTTSRTWAENFVLYVVVEDAPRLVRPPCGLNREQSICRNPRAPTPTGGLWGACYISDRPERCAHPFFPSSQHESHTGRLDIMTAHQVQE